MTKYEIKEVNCETGEEIVRDMTEAEVIQRQKDEAEAQAIKEKSAETEANKAALLAKLGITADEAALLLA
jgi:hypothetical protein